MHFKSFVWPKSKGPVDAYSNRRASAPETKILVADFLGVHLLTDGLVAIKRKAEGHPFLNHLSLDGKKRNS